MRKAALLAYLLCFAALRTANPASAPVTVVLEYDQPYSAVSHEAMQTELKRLLKPLGLVVDLQLKTDLGPHAVFGDLMMFRMKGYCTMDRSPGAAILDERGPLGATASSDGAMMPFAEVDCDRVRRSIQRVLGVNDSIRHEFQFGAALSLVMAHEMYHIITKSAAHTKTGVTKQSFSSRDLVQGLAFPSNAQVEMRDSLLGRH